MSTTTSRRSRAVTLTITPLLAVAFGACGDDNDTAYCVDANEQVVENQYCGDEDTGGSNGFFWYYGGHYAGSDGGSIRRGARLSGGTKVVSTNKTAIRAKGGFGSSSRSSGVGRASSGSSGGGGSHGSSGGG